MNQAMADAVRADLVLGWFADAHRDVETVARAVAAARLHDATPCPEWDVQALLNHIVFVDLLYAAVADATPLPDPGADHTGADHVSRLHETGRLAYHAFARPGMLEQLYDSPWGQVPGAVMVQHVVNELLAHGWDLARATGQSTDLAPEAARHALGVVSTWYSDGRPGDWYAAPQAPPADASPADRLAAYLGRVNSA